MDLAKYLTESQRASAEDAFLRLQIARLQTPATSRFIQRDPKEVEKEIKRIEGRDPEVVEAYTKQERFKWFSLMYHTVPHWQVMDVFYSELSRGLPQVIAGMRGYSWAYTRQVEEGQEIDAPAKAAGVQEEFEELVSLYQKVKKSAVDAMTNALLSVTDDKDKERFADYRAEIMTRLEALDNDLKQMSEEIYTNTIHNAEHHLHLLGNIHHIFESYGVPCPMVFEPRRIVRFYSIPEENLGVTAAFIEKEHPTVISRS